MTVSIKERLFSQICTDKVAKFADGEALSIHETGKGFEVRAETMGVLTTVIGVFEWDKYVQAFTYAGPGECKTLDIGQFEVTTSTGLTDFLNRVISIRNAIAAEFLIALGKCAKQSSAQGEG